MKTRINKVQIVILAIIVLAVGMLLAAPTISDKPEMPETASYHYITTNLSAEIGDTYSTTWYYFTVDNCYDEHFAVWADNNLFSSYDPNDFTVTQEFGTGDTAMLTAGDIQVNRKVIPNGADSFKIEYTITNNGDQVDDLRLFQVLDYDIGGPENDYAWYVPETDWIWMTDDEHYQCGYSGDIPSTRNGCDYWITEIYDDYLDGDLNNQDIYPSSGTDDAGTGLQWNLGSLATGSSTSVTVTFWFGVPAGEEAPPILFIDPDPLSHDFGNVTLGETSNWTFDITNCGAGILEWNVSDDQTWIGMDPATGTTTTETDTVTVTINTTGLTPDSKHTGNITVNSDVGSLAGTICVYVIYPDTTAPMLSSKSGLQSNNLPTLCIDPSPPSYDFGNVSLGETRTWTFNITNCGKGTLEWNVGDDLEWISMDPTSGTTTTETDTVTVTINTTGLTCDAEYNGTIIINSNGGSKTGTIRVYVIDPDTAEPTLCTNPSLPSYDFGNISLGETRTWTFNITNCGEGTLEWNVGDDLAWISMDPTSGTTTTETDTVTVTINTTGLTCDAEHNGTITVSSDGGSKTGTFHVYVPCAAEAYVRSSSGTGTEKNVFAQGEEVYCYAGNLPANDPAVDIYVVPNKECSVNDRIESDVGNKTASTDGSGIIDVTHIWIAPLTAGNYDIIVDVDHNGVLDAGEPVDSFTIEVDSEEIPEFPTLAIPIIAMLCLAFIFQRRKN